MNALRHIFPSFKLMFVLLGLSLVLAESSETPLYHLHQEWSTERCHCQPETPECTHYDLYTRDHLTLKYVERLHPFKYEDHCDGVDVGLCHFTPTVSKGWKRYAPLYLNPEYANLIWKSYGAYFGHLKVPYLRVGLNLQRLYPGPNLHRYHNTHLDTDEFEALFNYPIVPSCLQGHLQGIHVCLNSYFYPVPCRGIINTCPANFKIR